MPKVDGPMTISERIHPQGCTLGGVDMSAKVMWVEVT